MDPVVEEKLLGCRSIEQQIDGYDEMQTPSIHLILDERVDPIALLVLNIWQAEIPSFPLCKRD